MRPLAGIHGRARYLEHGPGAAALLLLAFSLACGNDARAASAGDERPLAPAATVDDLFGEGGRARDASDESPSPFVLFLRLCGSVAVLLALLVGALILYRRWAPGTMQTASGDWVQVMCRAPLTPRHTLHVVRIGRRLFALGTSGESVTTLAELVEEDLSPSRRAGGGKLRPSTPVGSESDPEGLVGDVLRDAPPGVLDADEVPSRGTGGLFGDWKRMVGGFLRPSRRQHGGLEARRT